MTVPSVSTVVSNFDSKITDEKPRSSVIKWVSASWRLVLSELVSTTLLLLLGCMTCIPIGGQPLPAMYSPLGFGFIVMINIQIFGHISGAHMNPAVTLAAVIWGSLSIPLAVFYVIAQCIGAILGYGILLTISPVDLASEGICVTLPHLGLNLYQALGIEIALTTALNFLNCAVWDPVNKDRMDSVPVKFALAIAGLSLAGGPLTGASMNPARTLGPALLTGTWTAHWVYWSGPIIGGVIAPILYKFIWLNTEKTKGEQK